MRIYIMLLFVLLFTNCQTNKKKHIQKDNSQSFFVGTYTNGESKGIYKYELNEDGTLNKIGLVAKTNNPSFLAKSSNNKFLLAVAEIDKNNEGSVESFLIKDDSLKFISRSSSGGAHPCFINVSTDDYIITANYTGGNVGLLKLNKRGELSTVLDVQQHTGKGSTDRQKAPHAHSTWFEPSGNGIISVDLGTNELWFSHLNKKLQKLVPSNPDKLKMESGAGPRHLAFHPNGKWIYVVNELDCTVTLVQKGENGSYKKSISVSTLPIDFKEYNKCADIHVSSDGKFVYASNRGHNSIVVYSVTSNGTLTLINHQSTQGKTPRNFAISPDGEYLIVANQDTDNIVSFKRNKTTGELKFVDEIDAFTPVCILF